MIGLKRGSVKLAPSQKEWSIEFEREERRLKEVLGHRVVDIQHIGSTSVPGLTAKPIIDISIGIKRFGDTKYLLKPMKRLGYGFYKNFQKQTLFAKGTDARRTHYVHVMRYKGAKWTADMLFRDYLREHPQRARQYGLLKTNLARQFPNDRGEYTNGKNTFIKETLRLAGHKTGKKTRKVQPE